MAESSCWKSTVKIIPDITGEDEYVDLFGTDDAF